MPVIVVTLGNREGILPVKFFYSNLPVGGEVVMSGVPWLQRSRLVKQKPEMVAVVVIFINHFSGPGRAISQICVCVCSDSNFSTKLSLT